MLLAPASRVWLLRLHLLNVPAPSTHKFWLIPESSLPRPTTFVGHLTTLSCVWCRLTSSLTPRGSIKRFDSSRFLFNPRLLRGSRAHALVRLGIKDGPVFPLLAVTIGELLPAFLMSDRKRVVTADLCTGLSSVASLQLSPYSLRVFSVS